MFSDPIPFVEALRTLEEKNLLPTGLSSLELRDLPAEIRDASIFSARMNNAGAVQRFRDLVQQILSPAGRAPGEGINIATARARMQDTLRELGYDSEKGGFAGEEKAPFAERGSLRDLSSNKRLELMLKTKVTQMAQAGYKIQQNTPVARRMYPAWELVRVGVLKHADAARDWPRRWHQVGGQFYGAGRMIAPKDDPTWAAIGSTENFDDALDTETPPYAFNSHMTRRAVARAVCIELGVIKEDFVPAAAPGSGIKETAQASAVPFSRDFLLDLRKDLGASVEKGRIRLAQNSGAGVIEQLARWLTFRVLINAFNPDQPRGADGRFLAPDTGGGSGGAPVHPLDQKTPITAEDAADLMRAHPDHPTTRAFRNYITASHEGITRTEGERINATLRRLPVYTGQKTVFRGLTKPTAKERDALADEIRQKGHHRPDLPINSATKELRIARTFAGRDGHGLVLAMNVRKSARDIAPIVRAVAPDYARQKEIAIVSGHHFALHGENRVQVRGKASPLFGVEES